MLTNFELHSLRYDYMVSHDFPKSPFCELNKCVAFAGTNKLHTITYITASRDNFFLNFHISNSTR